MYEYDSRSRSSFARIRRYILRHGCLAEADNHDIHHEVRAAVVPRKDVTSMAGHCYSALGWRLTTAPPDFLLVCTTTASLPSGRQTAAAS